MRMCLGCQDYFNKEELNERHLCPICAVDLGYMMWVMLVNEPDWDDNEEGPQYIISARSAQEMFYKYKELQHHISEHNFTIDTYIDEYDQHNVRDLN